MTDQGLLTALRALVADRFPSLGDIAAEWDQNVCERASELEAGADQSYRDILVPTISELVSQYSGEKPVADLGCGLGFLTKAIADQGSEVVGVDVSRRSVEYAARRFDGIRFVHDSIAGFAQGRQSTYGACVANMVFHNDPDLHEDLEAVHRMLDDDGVLIASIPHPCFWFQTRPFADDVGFVYSEERSYKVPFRIRCGRVHRSQITYIHRSLEQYHAYLAECGFRVKLVREPVDFRSRSADNDMLVFVCDKR